MGRCQSRIKFLNSPESLDVSDISLALCKIADSYGLNIQRLIYEFVSRERIVEINATHLNHDYETDIITFDYCDKDKISGEIFLCLDVILNNALALNVKAEAEVNRVVFHGLLHLIGFKDKTAVEIFSMRQKEEECLKLMAEINE